MEAAWVQQRGMHDKFYFIMQDRKKGGERERERERKRNMSANHGSLITYNYMISNTN